MAKTVFITGASSGIGKATAVLFADKGWNVTATMRKPEDAGPLAERDNVFVERLDLLDSASIKEAVAAGIGRFGQIDVLLNNAGYGAYGPLEATPMDVLRRQFDVNVFGLVETVQAVLPGMRARGDGVIVNVSSVGGRVCYPLGALYHGSKWAVEGISEAVHFELKPLGIKVKLVEPGGVKTDFGGRSFVFTNDDSLAEYQPMVQAAVAQMSQGTPSGSQEPAEVAEVIFAAATDESDQMRFISGDGAKQLLASRYSPEQDEAFLGEMRKRFGM
jgi:NAD(P)-dependent dehydrogenase (short-subunit alcohol dehydrogenase family)